MKIILGYTITVTTVTTVTIPSTCDTKSDMQIYPFGTIYRRPFPNTLGKCISLPYGILKAETASMLATKTG